MINNLNSRVILTVLIFIFCVPVGLGQTTKKVAILNIIDKQNDVKYGMKLLLMGKISTAITNTSGYEGYDRVDLSSIMNEQEFQRTGLVNSEQIKKLGVMTGADYILIAEVAKFDDTNFIISSKILNVETAKLEQSADIQTTMDIETLEKNCGILATKLLSKVVSSDNLTLKDEVFDYVSIQPEFPGGTAKLMKWLSDNLKYPEIAKDENIQGSVIVQFVVKKDGYIGKVEVVRSKDPHLEAEAIRLVKSMPRWRPGLMNGIPVNVWFTLPITFKLQGV